MTEDRRAGDVDVNRYVVMIAARLDQQLGQNSATIRFALEDQIAELRGDAATMEMLGASVEGNVATVLQALLHDIPVEQITVPMAALDYAKRLAQRGVPVNALVRAYRLGQRRMTDLVFAELRAIDMEPLTRVAVIEAITTVVFEYVDWVSQQVVATYEIERERWLEHQNSIRAMRVRDVLGNGELADVDACSAEIRYPLRWQHLALVLWYPDAEANSDAPERLQQFCRDLATALDAAASPLFVAADQTSGWAWLPYQSAPGDIVARVRAFAPTRPDAPNIAIGAIGSGVAGFRRSHRQAQRVRTAALARSLEPQSVLAATDSGILASAVLATSLEEVRAWVADVLGALASDSEYDGLLRETLRVFLRAGPGYHAPARELNVDSNLVKDRVEQAVARRGRPIDDRPDVELALLVCHWYGAAVLQPT